MLSSILASVTAFLGAVVAFHKCNVECFRRNGTQKAALCSFNTHANDIKAAIALHPDKGHAGVLMCICDGVVEGVEELYKPNASSAHHTKAQVLAEALAKNEKLAIRMIGNENEIRQIFSDCFNAFKHALIIGNESTQLLMLQQTLETLIQFYMHNIQHILDGKSDLLMLLLGTVNEAFRKFKMQPVMFQCSDDINMPVAVSACIDAAVKSHSQLDFCMDKHFHTLVPYQQNCIVLTSAHNVCTEVAKLLQSKVGLKAVLHVDHGILKNVFISKHFAFSHIDLDFKIGQKVSSSAHFMSDSLILKQSKQQFQYIKSQTSLGTVIFLF